MNAYYNERYRKQKINGFFICMAKQIVSTNWCDNNISANFKLVLVFQIRCGMNTATMLAFSIQRIIFRN